MLKFKKINFVILLKKIKLMRILLIQKKKLLEQTKCTVKFPILSYCTKDKTI